MNHTLSHSLSIACLGLLISSCSSDKDVEVPPPRVEKVVPKVEYSGTAFDGLIIDGQVNIYSWDNGVRGEVLGSGVTDNKGHYEISIENEDSPLLICVEGVADDNAAHYVEEASESTVLLKEGDELCSARTSTVGTLKTSLTFFTNLAYGLAEYLVSTGMDVNQAIEQSNRRISTLLGIDIIDTVPLDITNIENATAFPTQSHKYGLATAAISQYMLFVSVEKNEEQAPHEFYNSMLFSRNAIKDIIYDGVLNGQAEEGMLSLGKASISTETYRHDLTKNLFTIMASDRNKTGLGPTDVMKMALAWNNSNDTIFGGTPVVNLRTTRPNITNVSIDDNAVLSATRTFSADISDIYGLVDIKYFFDDTELMAFVEGDAYSIELDTTQYEDGPHTVRIDTSNTVGGENSVTLNVIVANRETTIANIQPADGSYVRGQFTFSATVNDPLGVESVSVLVDGVVKDSPSDKANPSISIDSTELGDGDHTFAFEATNTVGFSKNTAVEYVVDNTPPALGFDNVQDNAYLTGVVPLRLRASDNLGLVSAQLLFSGNVMATYTDFSATLPPFNLTTNAYDDFNYVLAITGIDHAGNAVTESLNINIDNTPPNAVILAPGSGSLHSESFDFIAEGTDSMGVSSVALFVDNEPLEGNSVDVSRLSDGQHTLTAVATDHAGHTADASRSVTVDTTAPDVVITYPNNNSLHKQDFLITADISDTTQIASTQYYVDNTLIPNSLVNIESLDDGVHTITVKATDTMGFIGNSTNTVTVTTDANPPSLSISNPVNGSKIQGSVDFSALVSDAVGIDTVEFLLDGSPLPLTDNNPSLRVNTNAHNNGPHTLTVNVVDVSGYSVSDSVSFTISNPPAELLSFRDYLNGRACRGAGTLSVTGNLVSVQIWKASIPPAQNTFVYDLTNSLSYNGNMASFDSTQFIEYPVNTHQYLRLYNDIGDWFPTEIWNLWQSWDSSGPNGCGTATPNPAYQVVP